MDNPAELAEQKVQFYCDFICDDGAPCQEPCNESGKCKKHGAGVVRQTGKPIAERERMTRSAGRYYPRLPSHLKTAYRKIAASIDLQSLAGEIAMIELRINQIIDKLKTNETEQKWTQLKSLFHEFKSASRNNDKETVKACLEDMDKVINEGNNESALWDHLINDLFVKKAGLVQVESKRMYMLGATATAEQVRSLAGALITCFLEEVSDYDTRRRVIERIKQLKVFDWDAAPPVEIEEDFEDQ